MNTLEQEFYEVYNKLKTRLLSLEPFDLREKLKEEYEDELDMLYDLPYAQTTDNNLYYRIPLAVVGKAEDNTFLCIGTGEEEGESFNLTADEIPVESLFSLNSLIDELYV